MGLDNLYGLGSLRPGVCTSTSRPGAPFEGQLIYETDTDLVQAYNGSGWRALGRMVASTNGSVLQVVSTTKSDTFASGTVSAGNSTDITGLSATITPSSTSSKILVSFTVYGCIYVGGQRTIFAARCVRGDSTLVGVGDAAGSRARVTGQSGELGINDGFGIVSGTFLDSPATTSATTYKIQGTHATTGTSDITMYVNRLWGDNDLSYFPRTASFITLMEISG